VSKKTAVSFLNDNGEARFEQRRRTAAAPPDPERFFPTRSQVMFLRRMRFHGCILVRRPAVLALSCGIEQHDAAAVHF